MEDNEITIDLYDLFRKVFQFVIRTWKIAVPVLILTAAGAAAYIYDLHADVRIEGDIRRDQRDERGGELSV